MELMYCIDHFLHINILSMSILSTMDNGCHKSCVNATLILTTWGWHSSTDVRNFNILWVTKYNSFIIFCNELWDAYCSLPRCIRFIAVITCSFQCTLMSFGLEEAGGKMHFKVWMLNVVLYSLAYACYQFWDGNVTWNNTGGSKRSADIIAQWCQDVNYRE